MIVKTAPRRIPKVNSETVRDAIDAALMSCEARTKPYFVVEAHRDLAWVCDKYGTIDGPYRTVDAEAVAQQENEYHGF